MRSGSLTRAIAAAVLAAIFAAGCDRPPDEAWLRFLGFRKPGETTNLSVVNAKLDGTTDSVDAAFENPSVALGKTEGGTGILVNRAHVEYRIPGSAPRFYEYPVTLYLPATAVAGETTTGTLAGLPIVPASLKQWLNAEASFIADVTFSAVTDEGTQLDTTGSISVVLTR
jgi:hypothetical protein